MFSYTRNTQLTFGEKKLKRISFLKVINIDTIFHGGSVEYTLKVPLTMLLLKGSYNHIFLVYLDSFKD